jgi:hypothetical protein
LVVPGLIAYVDGFNLYYGLRKSYGRRYLWLDPVALARRLRPRSQLLMVRYFTAPVLDDPDAASRQSAYIQALKARNGELIEIVQGRYQRKTMTCRSCGAYWRTYEEKETDVNIAAFLVADVATGLATSAILISGDSDLAPAIRRAQALSSATYMVSAFPPGRFSFELRRLLPDSFVIGRGRIAASLLPSKVVDPATRHVIERPNTWL